MMENDSERTRWFLRDILPHEPALRRWLARNATSGVDPNDIIQETYTVLAEMHSVNAIRNPRAYLFQVARSRIVRHIRRAKIVAIDVIENLEQLDNPDGAASPEQQAIDRDELYHLARAISAMPSKMREAFVLRRVEGLSQRDIAVEMGISENTVEKHISRGIRFLVEWCGCGGKAQSQASMREDGEIAAFNGYTRNQSRH